MGLDVSHDEYFSHYKYYKLPADRPVRVLIDKKNLKRGAETIDPVTGQLSIDMRRLREIETNPFVEDSTEEEFNRLCAARIEEFRLNLLKQAKGSKAD